MIQDVWVYWAFQSLDIW